MSADTNVIYETEENPIELVKASRSAFIKLLACSGIGIILFVFGQQTFTHVLSFLGLAVFALPLVLSLCFGFSGIIDIGPVFRAIDTPIGNVIYRTMVPDIGGQMAANLALTLIRAVLMFFLSVALMPLLLVICFIAYKISRRKALNYAAENGIAKESVPHISALVVPIYIAVLVVSIITANLIDTVATNKANKEYDDFLAGISQEVYEPFTEKINSIVSSEYYAEAYEGENYTGGFVAQFTVDGKQVKCGSLKMENVIDSFGAYYIIDDVVYIDQYGNQKFTVCSDEAVIEALTGRYPDAQFGEDMTLDHAETGDNYYNGAMKNAVMYLQVTYNGERYRLHFDAENNLVGYGWHEVSTDMTETQFAFTENTVSSSIKEAAAKIIDGTAEIAQ